MCNCKILEYDYIPGDFWFFKAASSEVYAKLTSSLATQDCFLRVIQTTHRQEKLSKLLTTNDPGCSQTESGSLV